MLIKQFGEAMRFRDHYSDKRFAIEDCLIFVVREAIRRRHFENLWVYTSASAIVFDARISKMKHLMNLLDFRLYKNH